MAPEALKKRRYSEKSDVWAFAVLAWELLESGTIPFFELTTDAAVIKDVLAGSRLSMPSDCNPDLWLLLQHCWSMQATDRPRFQELVIPSVARGKRQPSFNSLPTSSTKPDHSWA